MIGRNAKKSNTNLIINKIDEPIYIKKKQC